MGRMENFEGGEVFDAGEGLDIVIVEQCASTNDAAKEMSASRPAPFAVLARTQTAGRGRLSRSWFASGGASICMSVVVDMPRAPAVLLESATVRAGVAVCRALNAACSQKIFLKWPNDIYSAEGKKIAGMLAELHPNGGGYKMVFGIGINYDLSSCRAEIPAEIAGTIDDIAPKLSRPLTLLQTAALAARAIRAELEAAGTATLGGFAEFDFLAGRRVDAVAGSRSFSGVAAGINGRGNLLVKISPSETAALNSGEATLRPRAD